MSELTEIDQLIEHGLDLYGQGDLDGALLAWEKALAIDPENAQANSYVDYVRMNYELLTGDSSVEQQVPFGLEEEPYQIEILPGEALYIHPTVEPPRSRTAELDAGWFMEEERSGPRNATDFDSEDPPISRTRSSGHLEALELQLQAEEPSVNFDDQTREYQKGMRAPQAGSSSDEFASFDLTPGVDSPAAFAQQTTGVRERDLGFVRSTRNDVRVKLPLQPPQEPKMPRTPGDTADPYGVELPEGDAPPVVASVSLSYDEPSAPPPPNMDLINSLPTPTPSALGAHGANTRDLPPAIRPPAQLADEPSTSGVNTRDFESAKTNAQQPKVDLHTAPTRDLPDSRSPAFDRGMVSAPTRDLGLRPSGGGSGDEEPTAHHKPSNMAARGAVGDGTRADVILPFDPIDARSAQILDDVDEGAPEREAKEDKTRRRITTLFERAVSWAQAGELDKAVASIDLALSEDPNSALAQKLIHRHRDTMMQVFQQFLGDLDRQPVLARPLHELANAPISPRAAFLLSRIDGTLSLDELLDVSGMPKIEAYRYLCQLFLRGILR